MCTHTAEAGGGQKEVLLSQLSWDLLLGTAAPHGQTDTALSSGLPWVCSAEKGSEGGLGLSDLMAVGLSCLEGPDGSRMQRFLLFLIHRPRP